MDSPIRLSLTGIIGFADRPERYQFAVEIAADTDDVTMTVDTGRDEDGGQIVSLANEETAWAFETIAQGISDLTARLIAQRRPQEAA